jgi:hypothetical protein
MEMVTQKTPAIGPLAGSHAARFGSGGGMATPFSVGVFRSKA